MPNKLVETIKNWFKKGSPKPAQSAEPAKKNLLKELCGDDTRLYEVLSNFLYIEPLKAISKKDIDTLAVEAEQSGNFKVVAEKAFFEGSQNPEKRGEYIELIRNLMPKIRVEPHPRLEELATEKLKSGAFPIFFNIIAEISAQGKKFTTELAVPKGGQVGGDPVAALPVKRGAMQNE